MSDCQPDEQGFRGPIDADKLLRNILRRALRRAGLPLAEIAGLTSHGNKLETRGSVPPEESELSHCFYGSPGWNRTNDQRINSPLDPVSRRPMLSRLRL
jgi:hypothetical protein